MYDILVFLLSAICLAFVYETMYDNFREGKRLSCVIGEPKFIPAYDLARCDYQMEEYTCYNFVPREEKCFIGICVEVKNHHAMHDNGIRNCFVSDTIILE